MLTKQICFVILEIITLVVLEVITLIILEVITGITEGKGLLHRNQDQLQRTAGCRLVHFEGM